MILFFEKTYELLEIFFSTTAQSPIRIIPTPEQLIVAWEDCITLW